MENRALFCLLLFFTLAFADEPQDPKKGEVPLPAAAGWNASLVIDNGETGIWTVKSFQIFPQYACPEVVGLDDKGRCLVLISYSGRWTPYPIIHDHQWLGGLAQADLDPRVPGKELYTGGKRGNLYQVVAYTHGALDCRLIAHLEGREIHTLVPVEQGLVMFTRPGGLFLVTPTGKDGKFETRKLADLEGRVRDAVRLATGEIATVSRTGKLSLLRLEGNEPQWRTIYSAPMGMGRIAERNGVLYTTHDDGRILRHERNGGLWTAEVIFMGPQGPRGLVADQFNADPGVETVAVFGYSGKVQLLSREARGWKVETLFQDKDKGHWLAAAEIDGRNNTRELLASGYAGRIVMLARPPGYGTGGAVEPQPPASVKR